jgi:hypothetical protein
VTPLGTIAMPALSNPAGLALTGDGHGGTFLTEAPCFAAGTRIRTMRGDVAVEALQIGDCVLLAAGGTVPIIWIGHRHIDCHRHLRPHDVCPVRISAGAFGEGIPSCDLYLSPDHAVYVDNILIPVRYLINGRTVAQEAIEEVTYYHVELPAHNVIFAESLRCESYLDTGNRSAFANGGPAVAMHPDFARGVWEANACADLVLSGERLAEVKQRLLDAAVSAGFVMTRDANLRIVVGGQVFPAAIKDETWHVHLPPGASSAKLISRVWVPANMRPREYDTRSLGVAISQLWRDGRELSLDSPELISGWHAPEPEWRWTNGDACLSLGGARHLAFRVAISGAYWCERRPARRPARAAPG